MKISAFTCIRNGISLGYPWVEALLSVLPVVDEFLLVDYYSRDGTYAFAKKMESWNSKIRVIQRPWPEVSTDGSSIGLAQTEALHLCSGDLCLLVQADEIHHEDAIKDYPRIFRNFYYSPFNGIEFDFRHVIHNFQEEMVNPAYTRAIRVVRKLPKVISCHDGFSFWYAEPLYYYQMPQPIFHCGYEFPVNIPKKHLNHQQLYKNMAIYQQAASDAEQRLDRAESGDFDEIFTRTETKLKNLPAILRGLIGRTEYTIREEYLQGWAAAHS